MSTKLERVATSLKASREPYKRVLTGSGEIFTAYEVEGDGWTVIYDFDNKTSTASDTELLVAVIKAAEQTKTP